MQIKVPSAEVYAVANADSGVVVKDDFPTLEEASWYAARLAVTYGVTYVSYPHRAA